jgi:hypothetical protein
MSAAWGGMPAMKFLGAFLGSAGRRTEPTPRATLGGGGWRGSFLNEVQRLMPIIERPQSEGLQQEKS